MKLIIDIDKETYKKCKWKNNGVVGLEWWERAIANGTPIPDNATNGDVIKNLFADFMYVPWKEWLMIDLPWWNTPYQKGGKE